MSELSLSELCPYLAPRMLRGKRGAQEMLYALVCYIRQAERPEYGLTTEELGALDWAIAQMEAIRRDELLRRRAG